MDAHLSHMFGDKHTGTVILTGLSGIGNTARHLFSIVQNALIHNQHIINGTWQVWQVKTSWVFKEVKSVPENEHFEIILTILKYNWRTEIQFLGLNGSRENEDKILKIEFKD